MMTNEFPTGSGRKTYADCVFVEETESGEYELTGEFRKMLRNPDFYKILKDWLSSACPGIKRVIATDIRIPILCFIRSIHMKMCVGCWSGRTVGCIEISAATNTTPKQKHILYLLIMIKQKISKIR